MDEAINISTADNLVVRMSSKVIVNGMIVIEKEGEELVHADAVVDFDNIPVEHHAMVVNLLMQQRMRLVLPSDQRRFEADRQFRKLEEKRAKRARGWLYPFGAALTGLIARMKS